nr:hypothetical protein Iba_chr03dCG11670 [Ipomoea batatas]GMD64584.1 hypothetical protein Iba_chr12bCG25810 [Ipomoea batatas]
MSHPFLHQLLLPNILPAVVSSSGQKHPLFDHSRTPMYHENLESDQSACIAQ